MNCIKSMLSRTNANINHFTHRSSSNSFYSLSAMLRFVPVAGSLSDNAPGYDDPAHQFTDDSLGPICWKCSGTGSVSKKLLVLECKVCNGSKRLPVKSDVQRAKKVPGSKTKQTLPPGWAPTGPHCFHGATPVEELPVELMLQDGEQMCVFVGDWRIIQRKGGHRWTTDDIVTAWVAGKLSDRGVVRNTLDLGCGNGSVLMMVAWQYPHAMCFGMEARSEAVGLARRSIQYNVGTNADGTCRVTVANRDFRELIPDTDLRDRSGVGVAVKGSSTGELCAEKERGVLSETFGLPDGVLMDLVTGTPPYFQVDFALKKPAAPSSTSAPATVSDANAAPAPASVADSEKVGADKPSGDSTGPVERALIRQGGMPTCKESAPARCEFRGGIEAYCAAAAATMAPHGVFVVCENFANHERALVAARNASLDVVSIQRVLGKEGKPPLFCVYTMVHAADDVVSGVGESKAGEVSSVSSVADGVRRASVSTPKNITNTSYQHHYEEDLVVRDLNGAWTPQYAQLLRDMSYPVASLHPNGSY